MLKLGFVDIGVDAGPASGTLQVVDFVEGLFPFLMLIFIMIQEVILKSKLN